MNEKIIEFINNREDILAAYGYGSGIFKQSGYKNTDKKQIDLIFVVDDLKKWHEKNMQNNPDDYSMIGRNFFKNANPKRLKGLTGVTYQSDIHENDETFKYGTIEYKDLVNYLTTWKSFYMPGRFQKTIHPIIENVDLAKYIEGNKEDALMVASFLQGKPIATKKEILRTLVSLSYLGDTRMAIAENPKKIDNIIEGSYDEYLRMYDFDQKYLHEVDSEFVEIDLEVLKFYLRALPKNFSDTIKDDVYGNEEKLRNKILEYFIKLNRRESLQQTLKGISTNGIVRSSAYAARKLTKRFKH